MSTLVNRIWDLKTDTSTVRVLCVDQDYKAGTAEVVRLNDSNQVFTVDASRLVRVDETYGY